MKFRVCILLTACVNPNGMLYTSLQNNDERLRQYKCALDFYLKNTDVPIVFVENTNVDISSEYSEYINSGRLEYITFDGNSYDRTLGKGYGEALIINEGFRRSKILNDSKYIAKITGRLIIKNINKILSTKWLCFDNVFRCDLRMPDYLWTMLILIESQILSEIFKNRINLLNDNQGVYFEHVLYKVLQEDKRTRLIPFIKSPIIDGVSGTVGIKYSSLISSHQLLDNLYYTLLFYKNANRKHRSFLFLILFRLHRFISKI